MTTVAVIAVCILLAGFFGGLETGIYSVNRLRLKLRLQQGQRSAEKLDTLLRDPQRLVTSLLVGQNLSVYVATLLTTTLLGAGNEFLSTLVLIAPVFVFAEVAPKDIFFRASDVILYHVTSVVGFFRWLLWPLSTFLQGLSNILLKPFGNEAGPEAEQWTQQRLRYFLAEGRLSGTLTEYQHAIADNVMTLKGIRVDKVMIPIKSVQAVASDASHATVLEKSRSGVHSRFPVRDQSGQVVGIVHMLDLFDEWPADAVVRDHARPAIMISVAATVVDALFTLQRKRQTMGVVVDEGGKAAGILTVKDLVEEIVGEIQVW